MHRQSTDIDDGALKFFKRIVIAMYTVMSFFLTTGCNRDHLPAQSTGWHDYEQTNLVADTSGFNAARLDANLGNPLGIAFSPKGTIWISCNHTGQSVIYDTNGNQVFAPVAMPLHGVHNGASPNGILFNTTSEFVANGQPARCICSTEDGVIAAWSTGDTTFVVADRSAAKALYKGIAMATDGASSFIYAADFFNGRIDVFDNHFNYITNRPFFDPGIPEGFAPFNICNIGGKLFVSYAKRKAPDNTDDQAGIGNGFINIFNPDGTFVRRFATQGVLNSPWGMVQAQSGFGQGANAILVANYGDGRINIFDTTGAYQGPLENDGVPVVIDGLWDVAFSPTNNSQLYFTAGPHDETYGLFGYLKLK